MKIWEIILKIWGFITQIWAARKLALSSATTPVVESPVTEPFVEEHLPPVHNDLEAEAPPKVIEPIKPPVPKKTELKDRLQDRRAVANQKYVYGERDWSKVTGICLHQTACVLGERPARWDTVGAHLGVTRSGQVIYLHDFNKLVVHGNQWNTQTVGIEIDGLYAGLEDDPSTVVNEATRTTWDDPTTTVHEQPQKLTAESVEATSQLIRFICDEVAKHGGKIKALVAHRQASASRENDPGEAIWKRIALPMSKELGLHDGGPGFKLSNGYPIPEQWDPTRKGFKY